MVSIAWTIGRKAAAVTDVEIATEQPQTIKRWERWGRVWAMTAEDPEVEEVFR